ncbi:MAG TPA: response regulator, partial [Terriglobales bacterium]|nr:response regulator [Terriglobales bacterium]
MKFLLIEDDAEVSAFVARGLGEQGHTVDTANDGQQGLFLCMSEPYDLIIVDRRLPKLDGLS